MTEYYSKKSVRRSGILLHISSLPGGLIGSLGREALQFIDFLHQAGQTVWQVLPHTHPAGFQSPYSSYSVFAGNPLLINLNTLEEQGILEPGSAPADSEISEAVDFAACESLIYPLLRQAFERDFPSRNGEISAFRRENSFWLDDYALFMALHTDLGDVPWTQWPDEIRTRNDAELQKQRLRLSVETDFWTYIQFLFFQQWLALKNYANDKGILILGDLPIYTAPDSADVWANSNVFRLGDDLQLEMVAGVPPDAFSETGQRWGNPLYDWEQQKHTGYAWWIERLRLCGRLYDCVRLDHFRALDEYYAIDAGESDARNGRWLKGPGMDFFLQIFRHLPNCQMIAEDLGILGDSVYRLLEESGLPGMKVLLFAFDPEARSLYLPHYHTKHSIAYIGTHDNNTCMGWMRQADANAVRFAIDYMHLTEEEGYHIGFIRTLLGSVANTAIIQMQDLLGLDETARMNTPGTTEHNWQWRMQPYAPGPELAGMLRAMTDRYGRIAPPHEPDSLLFL